MMIQDIDSTRAERTPEAPEAPSYPMLTLWSVGIALAVFTVAMLLSLATQADPSRLADTLVLVSAALLAEVLVARKWFDTSDQ